LLGVTNLTCLPPLPVPVEVPGSAAPGPAAPITGTARKSTPRAVCPLPILMPFLFMYCYNNPHY